LRDDVLGEGAQAVSGQPHTAAWIGRLRKMWDEDALTAGEIGERLGKSENAILHLRRFHGFAPRQRFGRRVRSPDGVIYPSMVDAGKAHRICDHAVRNRCKKQLWGWSFVDEAPEQ
jgi:hypothetical protein